MLMIGRRPPELLTPGGILMGAPRTPDSATDVPRFAVSPIIVSFEVGATLTTERRPPGAAHAPGYPLTGILSAG